MPVGDDVNASLVHDRDAAEGLGNLAYQLRIWVDRGGYVTPLENRMNKSGEFQSVWSEHRSSVTLDDSGIVCQVPKAVGVYHDWNVLEKNWSNFCKK